MEGIEFSGNEISTSNTLRNHRNSRRDLNQALELVEIIDNTIFDLEVFANLYQERKKIIRLLFIARSCPILALEAYTLAIKEIQSKTLDFNLYESIVNEYNLVLTKFKEERESHQNVSRAAEAARGEKAWQLDVNWIEMKRRKVVQDLNRLDVDLKTYQNNLIKESIRMGHRDLATFHHSTGNLQESLNFYNKSKDFSSIPQHTLEMALGLIELGLESRDFNLVRNNILKAEAALDHTLNLQNKNVKGKEKKKEDEVKDRDNILFNERLSVAMGITDLSQGRYNRAARQFLNISSINRNEHFIHPIDIGIYATLCGLATLDRGEIKRMIVDNINLKSLFELEPFLKEIINNFYESKYSKTLELLNLYKPRFLLDIYLSHHVNHLFTLIQNRAIIQYFTPFNSCNLNQMALAFGFEKIQMQKILIELIQSDQLQARIDLTQGVIKAYDPSKRSATFKHTLKVGEELERTNRNLLWRLRLIAQDVIVKAPNQQGKGRGGGNTNVHIPQSNAPTYVNPLPAAPVTNSTSNTVNVNGDIPVTVTNLNDNVALPTPSSSQA